MSIRPLRLVAGRASAAIRRIAARHPWSRWIPATACGASLVLSVHAHTDAVDARRRSWGQTLSVPVAAIDHAPGDPLVVDIVELPLVAVPDSSATSDLALESTARQHIGAGEVVTDADLAAAGPLPLLAEGWRAIAVPLAATSGATPGEVVDLASDGILLAESAIVVGVGDDDAWVGVPADVAPLIALAAGTEITLLRTGLIGLDD